MTLGTGIVIAAMWGFAAVCAAAPAVRSWFLCVAFIVAIFATFIAAVAS